MLLLFTREKGKEEEKGEEELKEIKKKSVDKDFFNQMFKV